MSVSLLAVGDITALLFVSAVVVAIVSIFNSAATMQTAVPGTVMPWQANIELPDIDSKYYITMCSECVCVQEYSAGSYYGCALASSLEEAATCMVHNYTHVRIYYT